MSWSDTPRPEPAKKREGIMVGPDNRDEALTEILTKGDAVARAMGRAVANGWPEAAHDWFRAETADAGGGTAMQALIQMQLSLFAGIVGQLPPFLHADLLAMYQRAAAKDLPGLVGEVHQAAGGRS